MIEELISGWEIAAYAVLMFGLVPVMTGFIIAQGMGEED